jgi:hypothetical protein
VLRGRKVGSRNDVKLAVGFGRQFLSDAPVAFSMHRVAQRFQLGCLVRVPFFPTTFVWCVIQSNRAVSRMPFWQMGSFRNFASTWAALGHPSN